MDARIVALRGVGGRSGGSLCASVTPSVLGRARQLGGLVEGHVPSVRANGHRPDEIHRSQVKNPKILAEAKIRRIRPQFPSRLLVR